MARIDRQRTSAELTSDLRAALGELLCLGRQRLAQAGVSMGQVHLLSMLARHGAMPMGRIAEVLDISMSNATGIVDRMEEHGYVERVRVADDRRVVLVQVTDTGRATLADLELVRDDLVGDVLARLDDTQLGRLVECAADLRGAVLEVIAVDPERFAHHHQPARHAHAPDAQAATLPSQLP